MKLQPLGDRVIVRPASQDDVTESGIVLPDTVSEKPQRGEVVAVGEGAWVDGARVAPDVAVGDDVFYAKFGGTEVRVDGEDVMILSENDILAKVGK